MSSGRMLGALRRLYIQSGVRRLMPFRARVALRGVWLVFARRVGYPISSPHFQRPRLARSRRPFRLGSVLLACDLNRDYLDFWPSTRRAWQKIGGFNAALPATWGEVFEIASIEDVRSKLTSWGEGLDYDGRRGWSGWYTDQHRLYETLLSWPARSERLWVLDDQYCRYRRLDRMELAAEIELEQWRVDGIKRLN